MGWMILRPSIRMSILPWPLFLTLLEEEFQESQMFQRVVNFRLRPTTHTTIRPASLSVRRLSIGGGALHHTLDSSRIGRRSRESSSTTCLRTSRLKTLRCMLLLRIGRRVQASQQATKWQIHWQEDLCLWSQCHLKVELDLCCDN